MYGNGLWVGRRLSAHGLRHVAPVLFYGALAVSGVLAGVFGGPWKWILLALAGTYLLGIGAECLAWLRRAGSGVLLLPLVFPAAHGAYAVGTVHGLLVRAGASRPARDGSPRGKPEK